ncbi:hypothetical protein HK102_008782 [Quaeritorhiza haematococci]|nr:hypothetical protein HK102_008782 [Quaeritorhiza haematococci]
MSADFSFMEEDNIPELPPPINIDLQQITSSESAVPSLSSTRAGSRPIDVDSSRGLTSTFAQRFGQGAQGSQFEDPFAPGAAGAKKAVKKPRFVKKLDANLLLSDDALPRLLRSSKKLKFKGKGHEVWNAPLSYYSLF